MLACFGARWWYGLASLVAFLGLGLLLVWVRLLQAAVVLGDLVIACGMCWVYCLYLLCLEGWLGFCGCVLDCA